MCLDQAAGAGGSYEAGVGREGAGAGGPERGGGTGTQAFRTAGSPGGSSPKTAAERPERVEPREGTCAGGVRRACAHTHPGVTLFWGGPEKTAAVQIDFNLSRCSNVFIVSIVTSCMFICTTNKEADSTVSPGFCDVAIANSNANSTNLMR